MSTETFIKDKAFLTPAFRIELNGQDAGREVISDVLEVSFTDDLTNIDSFEFVLHDWDPIGLRPRYSSPKNEQGKAYELYEGGPKVPSFDLGAKVSLYLGYLEDGELPLIMEGEVVSLAPSFPATGAPTCRVRALNAFLRKLQRTRVEDNNKDGKTYDGTPKEIVDRICQENSVSVRWATLETEGKFKKSVAVEGVLYDEIASRAKGYGLNMMTEIEDGAPILYLAKSTQSNDEAVADFVWGRTLISFTPVLSVAGLVSKVVCRGSDPSKSGDAQKIEVEKTWDDVRLLPSAQEEIKVAVSRIVEVIKPDGVETIEDAERAALAYLHQQAGTIITGSGTAIGLPTLRAGKIISMAGLGGRFNGVYRLTQTTHSIGGSGYTTTFQCRKEVLSD